ncbi:hypothetical protein GCM10010191_44770 [Actinomadura vinacea]|uniref:Conjugal transfer protein TrbC n=1 Tax=Actinomadura vinacea TaxID=115336 RepID=A0ABN3JCK6_9ACTN
MSGTISPIAVSNPEIPTEKPKVPSVPTPAQRPGGPLPTNIPPPDLQQVDEGVSRPLTTILEWIAWCVFALCVGGVLIVAAQMAIKHKNGEAGAHMTGLGWVMTACAVAGSASAIIGGVLG